MSDDLGIKIGGDSTGAAAAFMQTADAAERAMKRTQQSIAFAKIAAKEYEAAIRQAKASSDEMSKAGSGAGINAGATRELIVLAHEMSQGNFSRFGGSLLVLTERVPVLTSALHSLLGPLGLVAVGVGAAALAFVEGAREQAEFNKALIATSNFAGLTGDRMAALARNVAQTTGATQGAGRDALQALQATGRFGPAVIGEAAEAVVNLQRVTGQSTEQIVSDFVKMSEAPAKWAAEAQKSYHFVDIAQYEHIKSLNDVGNTSEATLAVLRDMNAEFERQKQIVEGADGWWNKLSQTLSEAWQTFKNLGHTATPLDKLDDLRAKLAQNSEALDFAKGHGGSQTEIAGRTEAIRSLQQQIDAMTEVSRLQTRQAQAEADSAARNTEAVNAAVAGESAAKRLLELFKERLQSLTDEGAKLQANIGNWQRYGKAIDDSRLAVLNLDIAAGKLKGLGAPQIDQLRAAAAQDDSLARQLSAVKEMTEQRQRLARQQQEALDALNKHLADNSIAIDGEIEKMQQEAKFLGVSTVERDIAVKAVQLHTQALKELADYAAKTSTPADGNDVGAGYADNSDYLGQRQRALAQADADAKRYADAARANDEMMRSFSYGAAHAFAQYQADASNSAKFAEQFVTGSIDHMNDALVNFASTGKLSFKGLWQFMADEFLRNTLRMTEAKLFGDGSGILSLLGLGNAQGIGGNYLGGLNGLGGLGSGLSSLWSSLTGGLTIDTAGIGINAAGAGFNAAQDTGLLSLLPGLATGTNYVPYDGFQATLHKGEAVVPAAYNPSASGSGGPRMLTVINHGAPLGPVHVQQLSPDHEVLIINRSVEAVAAQIHDPNSRVSRAMQRNINAPRKRQ